MTTIYPSSIKPKYKSRQEVGANSTGGKAVHQAMKGYNNICSNDSSIAYWGDRFPDKTGSKNPERYYPNTVTTFSGSWNLPSPFSTNGWSIDKKIPDSAIVNKIVVEYAIAHVQYQNEHVKNAGWSYSSEGCKFYKKELSSTAANVKAESGTIAKNCQTDYKITLSGFGANREVSGEGLRYNQRITSNKDSYSSMNSYDATLYKGNDKKLTIGKLKKSTLTFTLPRNLNWDIGRIVMKYVRLNVEWTPVDPDFEIEYITASPSAIKTCPNSLSKVTVRIKSKNGYTAPVKVNITGNGTVSNSSPGSGNTFNGSVWDVKKFDSKNGATLTYYVRYSTTGKHTIKATVGKSSKSTVINVTACEPEFTFDLLQDNKTKVNNVIQHTPGNYYSQTATKFEFWDYDDKGGFFKIHFHKYETNNDNEYIEVDTGGLEILEWGKVSGDTNINITQVDEFLWQIKNINHTTDIVLHGRANFTISGTYAVVGKYINLTQPKFNKSKKYDIIVKGVPLGKEYFKLRLEDGSDVRYNSLMFTRGDDLKIPLTYTTEDIDTHIDDMIIKGNEKRIPVNEIQYVTFTIDLNTTQDIEIKNILSYIEVVGKDGFRCDDIIIGASNNVKLLDNDSNEKICVIDSLKSNETKTIKFAVQSDIEQECYIYLKPYNVKEPYNYLDDNPKKWIPAHVMFKDIPNIKIWIEGISDLNTTVDGDKFSLYYHIQNLSDIDGKNIRFQIKEPKNFNKLGYSLYEHTSTNESQIENGNNSTSPWFNENNRIITFPKLEAQNDSKKDYRLRIDYQATQKGIYDFIIKTLDNPLDLDDDQYDNSYTHKLLVDIFSDVKVTTTVSNKTPYVNELIDFNIKVENRYKNQEKLTFEIYDIGKYDTTHQDNHYEVQPYIDCEYGEFTTGNDSNHIGTWIINNAKANQEYNLTITLNPWQAGTHVIKTLFYDVYNSNKEFNNQVKVLERKKQISFNVYQAVSDNDQKCTNCDTLEQICDDDFINLKDKIYYVFEIQNNNRNSVENINVYARLPESFLTNGILCSSIIYQINSNNLISFNIPKLAGCKDEDNSKVKFCIKVQPNDIGNFISNFMLTTKNANVMNKQLKLTVDTEFNERKLEHEINIYNFDKTNRYYRYEIDNVGELFKFFNESDKSIRLIDSEKHNESSVETYRGTNLRRLVKEIKEKSKYVDPLFLREGSNKLQDKGYELYPDGFIRRFGLLNSEVYHYSNQLPITSNLVERAMKWDVDTWDTKVWAGNNYDNGIFDLTIDYSKVPSNFDILKVNNPINNLQAIVDNAKPYGTKAICYYSATAYLKLSMFISSVNNIINHNLKLSFAIPNENIGVISEVNRGDKSLGIYYDMFKLNLSTVINSVNMDIGGAIKEYDTVITPNIKQVTTTLYTASTKKNYIQDCEDIISNIYSTKEQNNNIDIIKKYNKEDFTANDNTPTLVNQQIINFTNNLSNNQSIGLKVKENKTSIAYTYNPHYSDGIVEVPDSNNISFIFTKDDINYFNGFKIIVNEEVINDYNIFENVNTVSMQIQVCHYDSYKILHFWGSINENDYYHIGYLLVTGIDRPIVELINNANNNSITSYQCDEDNVVIFRLSNRINKIEQSFDAVQSMERNNKWNNINNIGKKNKYASFKNNIDIDKECKHDKINVPKLVFKYNNIDIDDTDEVVDIGVKVKAQSNKQDFIKDINLNIYKDGDKYIPNNNIAKQIHYPNNITNVTQEFLATMQLEQPNFTMCSNCLKTSLGYYDECPYCDSTHVYHTNEKMAATVCHNCGYITKGWHDYCTHCLSYDIEKVKIDYNKTYCNNCGVTSDDYYNYCPSCFSSKVIHLTNNKKTYRIFDKNTQNIDPINITINQDKVNIFNLEVPFSKNTKEIQTDVLQNFDLHIHGTNKNDGKYYYCESCGFGDVGNYDVCPKCNSKLIKNYQINDYSLSVYHQNTIIGAEKISNQFDTKIDLQSLALKNPYNSFNLSFYIENESYNIILLEVLKLPINDEYQDKIIQKLLTMDISIDNLSLEYKYVNEKEWIGLDKLYNDNHTGIIYDVPYGKHATDNIKFNNFDIDTGKYKHATLYLHGIKQNIDTFNIELMIENNGHKYYHTSNTISNDVFTYEYDLSELIGNNIKDLNVQVYFNHMQSEGQISILDCNILTEKQQLSTKIHDNINNLSTKIKNENQYYYLLTSLEDNIWGLKDTKPYYLSGRQLKTNLIMYVDFGKLDLEEYIRLYDIQLIILYKNKMGQIVTENIPINSEDNIENLPQGAILPEDGSHPEQQFGGTIEAINGNAWLSLKYPREILNNLEYDITNINDNEELLNAIPLYNKISQSFILESNEISTISIDYYKNRGYPSNIVQFYLCEDDNNRPGRVIKTKTVQIDTLSKMINIDINAYGLNSGHKYWFVIEDKNANKNNYHQFKYNNNAIGQLIREENGKDVYDTNAVLSFSISDSITINNVYNLPTFWSIPSDDDELEYDSYQMHMNFYRYNIQENSNVSFSNLHINSGYNIMEDEADESTFND
ncbi:MAG: hypothetical protein J6A15_00930 [Clostridia bacterium]|nr:hypothetical protein [Clostridia bacterium]